MDGLWRFEACATLLNLTANVTLLCLVCQNPQRSTPRLVVGMQMTANVLWMTYAAMRGDLYLFVTSCSSACMQALTSVLLSRSRLGARRPHRIPQALSEEELPQR